MNKLIFLLVAVVVSTSSSAAPSASRAISTEELVSACGARSGHDQHAYCETYGQGVYDAYLVTRHPKAAPSFICVVQPAPTRSEVMDRYVDWSKLNPEFNSAPAADSLLRFLAIRFPCEGSVNVPENAGSKVRR